uniref:Uncharacterized protein n=1 Tax=Ditylenchus dipsaci TaxID=166011 RepID=A0A915DL15_9BILA
MLKQRVTPELQQWQQKPVRHGLCRTLHKDFHWKCLLSLLVHLCISYTIWCHLKFYAYAPENAAIYSYRNGDAITATQVYYERVNSHSSGNVFLYDCCGYRDISKELVNLDKYPVIRMKFTKGLYLPVCKLPMNLRNKGLGFSMNEVRDDYMEVREGLDLVDVPFTEHLLVYPQSFNAATTKHTPKR